MKGRIVKDQYSSETKYYLGDAEVTKEEYDAAFPSKLDELLGGNAPNLASNTPSCWPKKSRAFAVHPKQVEEANKRNKRMGCNVRYDKDGSAILPDRGARRDLLKVEGFHDNESFFGY